MRAARPAPVPVSGIRLTDRDRLHVEALIRSGRARNTTDAIRFALQQAVEKTVLLAALLELADEERVSARALGELIRAVLI